jgi:hypothetical protein
MPGARHPLGYTTADPSITSAPTQRIVRQAEATQQLLRAAAPTAVWRTPSAPGNPARGVPSSSSKRSSPQLSARLRVATTLPWTPRGVELRVNRDIVVKPAERTTATFSPLRGTTRSSARAALRTRCRATRPPKMLAPIRAVRGMQIAAAGKVFHAGRSQRAKALGLWPLPHSLDIAWRWTMTHLTCPRCRLSIAIRAPYLMIRNCPRCLARAGLPTPMYATPSPASCPTPPPTLPASAAAPLMPRRPSTLLGEEASEPAVSDASP